MIIEDYLMRELKEKANRTDQPLKKVVNEVLRAGLQQIRKPEPGERYKCKTYSMGYPPRANLDKALEIASVLEDEEIIRKLSLRK